MTFLLKFIETAQLLFKIFKICYIFKNNTNYIRNNKINQYDYK